MKKRAQTLFKQILDFLTNKKFIFNLAGIAAFICIMLFGILQWLRIYTHHGQKLEMPNYIDVSIDEALNDAKSKSFELIVNDSVHIVDVPGGIIRLQNPPGGSWVKQNRKVYVTITKFIADQIDLADIYEIYGANYDLKSAELRGRGVNTVIKETQWDPADGVILEVWYRGRRIISRDDPPDEILVDKGSTLEFVVSSNEGGSFVVADVRGLTVNQARFALRKFQIRKIESPDGKPIENIENAVVLSQDPLPNTYGTSGQSIDLIVAPPN